MKFLSGRIWAVIIALLLFSLIYFTFSTVGPPKSPQSSAGVVNKSIQAPSLTQVEQDAMANLSKDSVEIVKGLMKQTASGNSSMAISNLKTLSGLWYRKGNYLLAGIYAAQVAQSENTAAAWNIAGSTFLTGLTQNVGEQNRQYIADEAIKAFDQAVKLDESNIDYKVNRASVYAEVPPADNPMEGIMQLLELNKANPDNITVLLVLGKLGLKTGQYAKVVDRLEKVLSLAPDNTDAICMLAIAYKGVGNMPKATEMEARCKK